MKKTLIGLLLVFIFWTFDMGGKMEQTWLQLRMQTLTSELEKNRNTINAVLEIGTLIDSIDKKRNDLVAMLDERKSFHDYNSRLQAINNYIQDTKIKIGVLDERISQLENPAPGFSEAILGLKKKLDKRNQELERLKEQFIQFREENNTLFRTVSLHEEKLTSNENQLALKNEELKALEVKIQEAWEKNRIIEAESLYGLANSIEQKANRTHFAPEKKRHELAEALDLYRQSLAMGNEEAHAKVEELQDRIGYERK